MLFFPPSVIAYGWVCEKHVHISAVCVMLFLAGFFQMYAEHCMTVMQYN